MAYSFVVRMEGVYHCAYCGKTTKQRPTVADAARNLAYPPCCLPCLEQEKWCPEPATDGEIAMIEAFCDDASRRAAKLQSAWSAIQAEWARRDALGVNANRIGQS